MAELLFYAVMTGLVLGVFYDALRFLRMAFNSRFLFDFLFWIVSAFAVFSYLLIFNNGEIRAIYLLLMFFGYLFYMLTLGYVTKKIEVKFAKNVKIWLKKVKNRLKKFKKVLHYVNTLYYNIEAMASKIIRKKYAGDIDEEEQANK